MTTLPKFSAALLCLLLAACGANDSASKPVETKPAPRHVVSILVPATFPDLREDWRKDGLLIPAAGDSAEVRQLRAACRVMAGLAAKEQIVQLTPEFLNLKIKAAVRVRDCQFAIATLREDRISIATSHVQRMQTNRMRIWGRRSIDVDAATYNMAEAALAEAMLVLERESK